MVRCVNKVDNSCVKGKLGNIKVIMVVRSRSHNALVQIWTVVYRRHAEVSPRVFHKS